MIRTGIVYNLILLFVVIGAYFAENGSGRRKRIIGRVIVFLALFIPAAVRYGIGTDFRGYVFYFYNPEYAKRFVELGYFFLQDFIYRHWGEEQLLFAIVAALTYLPICIVAPRKNFLVITLFYALTLYLGSYSTIRQAVAVSFCLCGTMELLRGRDMRYLIWGGLACLFHFSAVLILLAYVLSRIRISRFYLITGLVTSFVLIHYWGLMDWLLHSSFFLNSEYGGYASGQFARETAIGTGLGIIMKMLIPILGILNYKSVRAVNERGGFLVNMCGVYLLAYLMATQIHIFNRLVDTFSFVPILMLVQLNEIRNKWKKIWVYVVLVLFFINFQRSWLNSRIGEGGIGISPYSTIFDDKYK